MAVAFSPNSPDFNNISKCTLENDDIEIINCQFVDIDSPKEIRSDETTLSSWKQQKLDLVLSHPVQPSVIVDTKNGIHVYYLLDTPGDKNNFRYVQKQLVQCFEGDEKCVNLARVMRLPYFYHVKKAKNPYLVSVIHWKPENKYEQDYLTKSFPPLDDEQAQKLATITSKASKNVNQNQPKDHVSEVVINSINHNLIALVKAHLELSSDKPDKLTCRCCLPGHEDKNPSAWFDKVKLWYHCSGCGASLPLQELAEIIGWDDVLLELKKYDLNIIESVNEIRSLALNVSDILHLTLSEQETNTKSKLMQIAMKLFHKNLGQDLNDKHEGYIESIINILVKGEQCEYLIPLTMGGGKTILCIQYAITMSRLDDKFGMVICRERIKSVMETATAINKILGRVVAYPMYGYDPGECVSNIVDDTHFDKCQYSTNPLFNRCKAEVRNYNCRYHKQKYEFRNYPILVMTQQRLFMDADVFAEKYKYYEVNGENIPRTRLIIDEKPILVRTYQISSNSFHGKMEGIRKKLKKYKSSKNIIGELNDSIRSVTGLLEPSDAKREDIKAVKPDFNFSPEFWELIQLAFNIDDKPFQVIESTEKIIGNGCIKESNQDGTVTLSLVLYKEYKDNNQFCTVILDGTADLDKTYKHENYHLIRFEPIRTYENLEFYLCDEVSSSRTSFKKTLDAFCQEVKEIANKYPEEEIYVPVYMNYEEQVKSLLADYIKKGQIKVAHFGATRGSNEFKDCSIIIVGSILNKTEAYYLSLTKAVKGKVSSLGIWFDSNRNRRFNDKDAEIIKLHDMIVDYSQEIARTSQRDNTKNVKGKVFIFTKDRAFLEAIRTKFPESQVKKWVPFNIIEGKIKSRSNNLKKQALIEILKTVSDSISFSKLKEQLDMTAPGLNHLIDDNKELIEMYGFKVEKEEGDKRKKCLRRYRDT